MYESKILTYELFVGEKLLLLGDVNLGGELILVGVCLELRINGRCVLNAGLVCFQFQHPRQ